jgi:hypothetical protein
MKKNGGRKFRDNVPSFCLPVLLLLKERCFLRWVFSRDSLPTCIWGDAFGLKCEPLACLKIFWLFLNMLRFLKNLFSLCKSVEYVGQTEEIRTSLFLRVFQAFAEMGRGKRSLFAVGARRRNKCPKKLKSRRFEKHEVSRYS